ncbi:nuclear pore complex protein NUP98A-like isoform X3 [Olea europaea var. sylvestris]|uniref:nuclear pore complex protein NUP98A-like isoform X3 n=1 Tax=Olea europaea var. sylvestris TaxID=158386 RepID=UPI000C1D67A3|nr:nuclear pore complex protein NUP98A-like isoform X3 [Olea europaea var. sylvestris]
MEAVSQYRLIRNLIQIQYGTYAKGFLRPFDHYASWMCRYSQAISFHAFSTFTANSECWRFWLWQLWTATNSANVFGGTSSIFGHGTVGQPSGTQSSAVAQSALATNPFGTLPAMPQISIGRTDTSPSIQYGISSLPQVVDKPVPIRISSFLTSRHLSHRCIRLPARKYHPKNDGPKVPFFSDDEETPSTPKADALYIPRENPRSLEIRPLEQISSRASSEKRSPSNPKATTPVHENGKQL